MPELKASDFADLAEEVESHREQLLERLSKLEWAADDDRATALVQDPEHGRRRAAVFLGALVAGLRGNWAEFDAVVGSRTADLLAAGVVSPEQLSRRALELTAEMVPIALSAPNSEKLVEALFATMQQLSSKIIGEHNRRLVDELRRVDDVKTMFLRVTTHELRAPLTALRGYASMLRAGDLGQLPAPAATAIEAMARAAQASLNLVDRLVEAARLEGGAETLTLERHRISDVVATAVEPLQEAVRLKRVDLVLDVADEWVEVDLDLVAIAVRNLLGNALKYASAGTIWVRARLENDQAVFEVEDQGPGIPDDEQALVFDRYYRSQRTRESGVEGTGLGLYIVSRIAELHGGKASVVSEPGEGATFRVRVPARPPGA
jgi:signal transduction histidine kinase